MEHLLIYIFCCSIAVSVTPFIAKLSVKLGAVDKPNKRKVHDHSIPTLGGLAIFISFILGHFFFEYPHFQFKAILIGAIIIVITGVIDDIYDINPKTKLFCQAAAATIVIFYGNLYLKSVNLPVIGTVRLPHSGIILTYLWIIGITNAINLIDGLDGLASGVATITFMTMYVLSIIERDYFVMTYALVFAGASTGFLVYNFHPAKIFMGDTGALFLGYIISVMSLMGFKNATFISFIVPILILGVPVFDTFFAIIRRKLRGQSFAQADKEHLHHLLMTTNSSQTKTVLIIYGISLLFSVVAVVYSLVSAEVGLAILVVMFALVQYFARKIGLLDIRYMFKSNGTEENTICEDDGEFEIKQRDED